MRGSSWPGLANLDPMLGMFGWYGRPLLGMLGASVGQVWRRPKNMEKHGKTPKKLQNIGPFARGGSATWVYPTSYVGPT